MTSEEHSPAPKPEPDSPDTVDEATTTSPSPPAITSPGADSEGDTDDTFPLAPRRTDLRPTTPRHSASSRNNPRAPPGPKSSSYSRNRSPLSLTHSHSRTRSLGPPSPVLTRAHSSPSIHSRRGWESQPTALAASPSLGPRLSPVDANRRFSFDLPAGYSPQLCESEDLSHTMTWSTYGGSGGINVIHEEGSASDLEDSLIMPPPLETTVPRSSSSSLHRRTASPYRSYITVPQPQRPQTSYSLGTSSTLDTPGYHSLNGSGTSHYPRSRTSSPAPPNAARYNEAYPGLHHHASNTSMSSSSFIGSYPSTPTSARSRSPSISSLETIEDAPELERKAVADEDFERTERMRLGKQFGYEESSTERSTTSRRRGSLDVARREGGFVRGRTDPKKRWSICGGETSYQLGLETIYED